MPKRVLGFHLDAGAAAVLLFVFLGQAQAEPKTLSCLGYVTHPIRKFEYTFVVDSDKETVDWLDEPDTSFVDRVYFDDKEISFVTSIYDEGTFLHLEWTINRFSQMGTLTEMDVHYNGPPGSFKHYYTTIGNQGKAGCDLGPEVKKKF